MRAPFFRSLFVLAIGALILVLGSPPAVAGGRTEDPILREMVDRLFAGVEPSSHMAIVVKDPTKGAYLAFYLSTYVGVQELRAYKITLYNVNESADRLPDIDALLAAHEYAEAYAALLNIMIIEYGSMYVADVAIDGIREGDVAVGSGHMRDNFHKSQFASYEEADAMYREWLVRAISLREPDGQD